MGIKELGELRNLTSLDLGGARVTDGGIIELGKLSNLTKLNIKVTQATDAGITELKKSMPKNLKKI